MLTRQKEMVIELIELIRESQNSWPELFRDSFESSNMWFLGL